MTFASAGIGSATHWAAERLRLSAGFNAVHVPFKGGPEALTDVATGRVRDSLGTHATYSSLIFAARANRD